MLGGQLKKNFKYAPSCIAIYLFIWSFWLNIGLSTQSTRWSLDKNLKLCIWLLWDKCTNKFLRMSMWAEWPCKAYTNTVREDPFWCERKSLDIFSVTKHYKALQSVTKWLQSIDTSISTYFKLGCTSAPFKVEHTICLPSVFRSSQHF